LYTSQENKDWTQLPSPQDLQGKVLIKGKRPPEEEEQSEESSQPTATSQSSSSPPAPPPSSPPSGNSNSNETIPRIADELAQLTFFSGVKFKSFDKSIDLPPTDMHSIGETKITKLTRFAKRWRQYNQQHMTRTYPAGVRVDSSNYNPILAWAMGCQMVALNFQTSSVEILLNQGRFRQNGECGYVLKPQCLLSSQVDNSSLFHPIVLKVRILSGSCLPKPNGAKYGEKTDPYVVIMVHDVSKSGSKEIESYKCTSKTTHVVTDNGFCPYWSEKQLHSFTIEAPPVAMVQFSLHESNVVGTDVLVCDSSIPLPCLRQGYRSVQLYDRHGGRTGPFSCATLLVEIQMEEK